MPDSIGSLPFDLVHAIAVLLDIRSYVNLARASRRLSALLGDENTARQCLERNVPYNSNASEALQKGDYLSFRKTLALLSDQREAIRTSSPYSVSILAFGSQFLFGQGNLCYVHDDEIRLLDTHKNPCVEQVISGLVVRGEMTDILGLPDVPDDFLQHITLLSCIDDIFVYLYEEAIGLEAWLLAWDLRTDDIVTRSAGTSSKLRLCRRVASKTKLFVRHNRHYLYYGTHSAQRDDRHHEWQLQGYNLLTGEPISQKPLQLYEFVGSEIGSTACFEVHGGYLYALSNQTSFDADEVDWTSSYHFVRFRLDDASPNLKLRKTWRRQHHEGPINDAWTDLSLQVDEETGELKIFEVRKEWLGGGSLCGRTSYATSFTETSDEDLRMDRAKCSFTNPPSGSIHQNSRLSWLQKLPIRIPKNCHHELAPSFEPQYDFICAKTKHHSYNSFAHAFIDLVVDNVQLPDSFHSKDRLRLRVASRIPASPLILDKLNSGHHCLRPQLNNHNSTPIPNSKETFTETYTALWPPQNAPNELFDLMCPAGKAGNVHAVSGERGIVYMADTTHAQHNNQRAIIMISFDPKWGHKGMKRLRSVHERLQPSYNLHLNVKRDDAYSPSPWRAMLNDCVQDVHMSNATAQRNTAKRMMQVNLADELSASTSKRPRVEASTGTRTAKKPQELLRTEPALYLSINQGFWLR